MLTTVAYVLAGLIIAGIFLIGAIGFWTPQNAAGFGIPDTPTGDRAFQEWLKVKALRDTALGVVLLIVMLGGAAHLLGWIMLAAAFVPVGDMLIVLRNKGPKATAFGVHGATALVMLVSSVLLLVV